MAWNYKILPDGYQQVEYLQTDGNAYIDTGFKPYYSDVSTRITGVFSYPENTPGFLLGSSGHNKKYFYVPNPAYREEIPDEYQQVEYLEATGTQYIDTGISINYSGENTLSFNASMYFTSVGASQVILGTRSGNPRVYVSIDGNSKWNLGSGTANTLSSEAAVAETIYDISADFKNNSQIFKVYGVPKITRTVAGASISKSLWLFAYNYSTIYGMKGRIYKAQIIVNDEIVRDFVPCLRKSDNKPGFYDLSNDQFYVNSGTNEFLYGSNVYEEMLDDPDVYEDSGFEFKLDNDPVYQSVYKAKFSEQIKQFSFSDDYWEEDLDTDYFQITESPSGYSDSYADITVDFVDNTINVDGTIKKRVDGYDKYYDYKVSEITLNSGKYRITGKLSTRATILVYDSNQILLGSGRSSFNFELNETTTIFIYIQIHVYCRYISSVYTPYWSYGPEFPFTLSLELHKLLYKQKRFPEKFTLNLNNNSCSIIQNGVMESVSFITPGKFELNESLLIFGSNNYGVISTCNQSAKIYELKIYNGTQLAHDFVPCYFIDDGTPGLFDIVRKDFLINANEESEFYCGPDIISNKEEGILITGRSVETSTEYAYLPDEYQQLEYIQATGTQYIMSNYYPNEGTKIVGKFMLPEKSIYGTTYLFGERSSYHGPSSWELSYDAKERMLIADIGRTTVNTIKIANGAIVEFELSATKALLNTKSEPIHASVGGISRYMLYIFGTNVSDTVMMMSPVRLYSFKIIEGDELVANYIPCYRKSDLLGGLYDVVNKIFYFDWSDKKIPFIKGPIVFPPVLKDISKTDLYLEVYDSNFNQLAVIDEYMSLIWSDRYDECGDFELQIPYDEDLLNDILKMDNFCKINLSDRCMIIEKIQYDIDEDDNETVIVSGRSAESLLERRVVLKEKSFGDEENNKKVEIQTIMKTLIEENIISPTDESRKISNFKFLENPLEEFTKMKVYDSYCGEDLYTIINSLCSEKRIGFKVTIDDRNDFTFSIYKGVDRTYDQKDNEYVVFSPYYDNLKNSSFFSSSEEFKNFMAVSKTANEYLEVFNEMNPPIGITRKEIYVNKSDLTKNGSSSISDKKAKQKAKKKLSVDYAIKKGFEGDIVPDTMFYYRVDYFIGDHVQLEDKHGHSYPVYISEIVITKNQNGLTVIPTFKEIEKEWDTPEGE